MAFGLCDSNCEHGGCCALSDGHAGNHDSKYCQWTDAEAIPAVVADAMVTASGFGLIVDLQRALESLDKPAASWE